MLRMPGLGVLLVENLDLKNNQFDEHNKISSADNVSSAEAQIWGRVQGCKYYALL